MIRRWLALTYYLYALRLAALSHFYFNRLYELAFNRHKVQEAAARYIGKTYLQHNLTVADGAQAFVDAFTPFLKENPQSRAEIKRVVAEGDLVVLHVLSRTSPQDKGEAVVDIFRFDGKEEVLTIGKYSGLKLQ